MPLFVLGLNHQSAPLALRERVAVPDETLPEALAGLRALPGVEGAALLSTCNRTELYCAVEPGDAPRALDWLAGFRGLDPAVLRDYFYQWQDDAAVRHLFRVATGLDSMVLGEPQILGQVKDAYQAARSATALTPLLDRLFQQSFAVAKRVRTDTRIGAHPVSVAFAAVRLVQQAFTDISKATVLLIGAGDTVELAATHLVEHKARRLLVANRTLEHAQALAARIGGYALPLAEIDRHLAEADIVLSATAAREPILHRGQVESALRTRRHRPMFLLDLAVPRDIAPDVAGLEDVYLYTIDDLEQVIEDSRRSRSEAAGEAQAIIDLQVQHFMAWWAGSLRQDALLGLRARGDAVREETAARARAMLAAGRPADQVLEWLARTLTGKLLHGPTTRLREAAQQGDAELLRAAERLFDAPAREGNDPEHTPQA